MEPSDIARYDTFATNVSFGNDTIEITFLEKSEQSQTVMMARTLVIQVDNEERYRNYSFLQECLRELIDSGYIELRNGPEPEDEYQEQYVSERKWIYDQMTDGEGEIEDSYYFHGDEGEGL
jgi:hypothetical protein